MLVGQLACRINRQTYCFTQIIEEIVHFEKAKVEIRDLLQKFQIKLKGIRETSFKNTI